MTETVAPPVMNPLYGERRNETLGRAATWARLRVVSPKGQEVSVGEIGELVVHGEAGITIMAGYHRNPAATRAAVRGGWLFTGDRVRLDEGGFLTFMGRKDDLIKPLLR